ncbi:DUF342 domain-containing protein [Thermobrachium celere]|uniref:Flagellar Assembly Protein A N-terminal region domain-containing protein n=1 Tax=Thermobrachium celere DSM 8682 TaxID=941824 RepID=R7RPF4_9CLOT|nr:FapA family protein [Thermobrachium celere]CDF58047.1 hypothetical protein TCEL_01961 [Thermobrachium celere DSM 8682]
MIVEKKIKKIDDISKSEFKNGKLIYYSGEGNINVSFNSDLLVKVNNIVMDGPFKFNADDILEVELNHKIYKNFINLNVSSDKLIAEIKLNKTKLKKWSIKDTNLDSNIYIDYFFTNEDLQDAEITKLIFDILNENKVIYGIQIDSIKKIIETGEGIIAQGKPPVDPIDDKIEYYFGKKEINNITLENAEKVDYYNNINEVDFVEKGSILATLHIGREGTIGFDIYGKPVHPRKRKKINIKNGPGCKILDEINAIAEISGMPKIKNNSICVFPTYKIKGDIDKKVGNIEFNGTIYIDGNVLDGIKIISGKEIIVNGNVNLSELYANADITVSGNVIGSKVIVGSKVANMIKIESYLMFVREFLMKLIQIYKEVSNKNVITDNDKISKLLKIIIISKLKTLKDNIDNMYIDIINTPKTDKDLLQKVQSIHDNLNLISIKGCLEDVFVTLDLTSSLIENIKIDLSPSDVKIAYCQNSTIFSTNNVEITGVGCYNTNVYAENCIIFKNNKSVLRGGKIEAKKIIKAREVGSAIGVTTILKTSKEGLIEADIVYQNTIIMFDEIKFKIDEPVKSFKAYMEKGELRVENLKL